MKQSLSVQIAVRRDRELRSIMRAIWASNRWAAKCAKLGWRRTGSHPSAQGKDAAQ